MPDVLIVGAGPVGTLLAGELTRRGIDVAVFERRPEPGAGSRAIGLHSPVLAALEPSGLTDRLLAHAVRVGRGEARSGGRVLGTVRFDRLSRRFPFVATLPQAETERVLAVGAPEPQRGTRVMRLLPGREAVRVRAAVAGRPVELAVPIVVVATGSAGRALAYRDDAVQVHTYRDRYLMTDAATGAHPDDGVAVVHLDAHGVLESFPLPGERRRFVAWDGADAPEDDDARLERLRAALLARGELAAAERVEAASAFGVRRAIAPRLRHGRLLVIGDAAHEVSPIGGQGLNLGLLDAVTLAPLLAAWAHTGVAPDADLRRWERGRVASARTAAALATLNTSLGRPAGPRGDRVRRVALRAMLAPGPGRLFAHAYAMGFDRAA